MAIAEHNPLDLAFLNDEIAKLLSELGSGKVEGVAYDTAWCGRLHARYPNLGFDACLEWLRENQYEDGSWGAGVVHHHDRFISTLAAIVALREAGKDPRDQGRIKRGERALWQHVGKLRQDDSDTIGFPIIALSLAEDAMSLGLDVPLPSIRYAEAYRKKVDALLKSNARNWLATPLVFSLEALRRSLLKGDVVLAPNQSVGTSPAATAGYLLESRDDSALRFLKTLLDQSPDCSIPHLSDIDVFEIAWGLIHLSTSNAVSAHDKWVQPLLDVVAKKFNASYGVSHSTSFDIPEVDDTAAVFSVLNWGGRKPDAQVFSHFEAEEYFYCFLGETNPSTSAQVRLLRALLVAEHPKSVQWIDMIMRYLSRLEDNGAVWTDKWHISPYYVTGTAISALHTLESDLLHSRLKWIIQTQNRDGGWGYTGVSTPEETSYCLSALLYADRHIYRINSTLIDAAAQFLRLHYKGNRYTELWIGKALYTPHYVVQASVLGALHSHRNHG